jgi:hypothetical protein
MRVPVGNNTSIQEIAAAVNELYDALQWQDPINNRDLGKIEPAAQFLRTNLLAAADGVNWDPNSHGEGYRRRTSAGTWVKLLEPDDTFATSIDADKVDGLHAADLPGALIWNKTVTGSAVTSVTTNGEVTLDGNTHGGYVLEFYLVENGASDYDLFYNNDTTAGNYYRDVLYANSAVTPTRSYAGDAKLILGQGNTTLHQVNGHIGRHPSGMPMTCVQYGSDTNTLVGMVHHRYYSTITNLTRIDIVASVASGIGVNSRFRLWRRM